MYLSLRTTLLNHNATVCIQSPFYISWMSTRQMVSSRLVFKLSSFFWNLMINMLYTFKTRERPTLEEKKMKYIEKGRYSPLFKSLYYKNTTVI